MGLPNLPSNHEVLTFEEVSSFLRVSKESLESEIASGRLRAFQVGSDLRILKQHLFDYIEVAANRYEGQNVQEAPSNSSGSNWFELELTPADPFSHKWPTNDERYEEAHAGKAQIGSEVRVLRIGFTQREAFGKPRKRSVVFVERRPLVEFVAADDFENNGVMVSLLKHKNGKQIRPGEPVPREYMHHRIEPYNKHVSGPYASSNLALVCKKDHLSVMAEHALLRLKTASVLRARRRASDWR